MRATAQHAWAFLTIKRYNRSTVIIAYYNILWIPLGELLSHLRQAGSWQGCSTLFKATWSRQLPINTDAPSRASIWFKGSSSDRKVNQRKLMWLSSRLYSLLLVILSLIISKKWVDSMGYCSAHQCSHLMSLIFTTSKPLRFITNDFLKDRISEIASRHGKGKRSAFSFPSRQNCHV